MPKNSRVKRPRRRREQKGPGVPKLINAGAAGQFMPPRLRAKLRFNKTSFMLNAGVANVGVRFEPTYAYDIDPTVGSTAAPGFTELGGLYRFYRVDSFRVKVAFANKDTPPATVYLSPVNFDPGANPGTYQNYLSNRSSKKMVVSGINGNSRGTLSLNVSVSKFGGSETFVRTNDLYSGRCDGTSAPTNNIWVLLGAYADAVMISGITYSIDIDFVIEFFELNSPAT